MRRIWASVIFACVAGPALAADPSGDWMVTDKTAVIRIAPCTPPTGSGRSARASGPVSFCGSILWTKGPPGADQNNPDPAKRSRSVIGMPTILDMKPTTAPNKWEGEIYNAENGKTYAGDITLASEKVLRIQGCVLGFLCGGQDWTRETCEAGKAASPSGKPSASTPARSPPAISCREQDAEAAAPSRREGEPRN